MAENPYVNKVEYGSDTLIDLTADTVTPQTLLEGATAHDRSGAPISGAVSTKTYTMGWDEPNLALTLTDGTTTQTLPLTGVGTPITVDTAMSGTSENAVQNKVIKGYVDNGLGAKQDTLTAGTGIKITNNVISAEGVNFEVGVERHYGTYTDENGVLYQSYSKIIYIPALPSTAGITSYPHGIVGIKQILQVYGFTTDGFVLNAPRQNAQDNIAIYQAQKAGNIAIEVGKDRSSKKAYVTLIYAKNN